MEINGIQFDVGVVTRTKRKEIVKRGFRYKDRLGEFVAIQKDFANVKEGDMLDFSKIPLSEEEIDILIEVVFEDRLDELETATTLECIMLASEIFSKCFENSAKN